jgi:hypothetical protein
MSIMTIIFIFENDYFLEYSKIDRVGVFSRERGVLGKIKETELLGLQ